MPGQSLHDVHLYLVSKHATPNVTPALDETTRPRKVVLLVSTEMQTQANRLEKTLHQVGIEVEHWSIDDAWDIEHIRQRVVELLQHYQSKSITLNATGGTKAMSIAAFCVFRSYERAIFYVHPGRDLLVWMHPQDIPNHQLANRIRIPQYIEVYGGQVRSMRSTKFEAGHREFAERVIARIEYFSKAVGTLNYFAHSAARELVSRELDKDTQHNSAFLELLEQLKALKIVEYKNNCLHFSGEEGRFFANGGWLEEYVFMSVNGLRKTFPALQDSAMSMEVIRGDSVKNEIDVAFLLDNKLHLIECKAKKFSRRAGGDGTDTLYKIDSLTDILGGVHTRSMLVSYKELGEHDLKRAEELDVNVVQYRELKNLESELVRWIKS